MAEEKAQTMQSTETITTASSVSETVASLKGIPTKEELIKLLETEVVEVTFTKLNGDKRVMPCTLIPSFLPKANKEDPMTQKHGMIDILFCLRGSTSRPFNVDAVLRTSEIYTSLPFRFAGIHVCSDDKRLPAIMNIFQMAIGMRYRIRFRAHFGKCYV